jgi:hypothetical protein
MRRALLGERSRRRRTTSSSNNSEYSLNVATMLQFVGSGVESTILSAQALDATVVAKEWTVLATLVGLASIVLSFIFLGHHLDEKDKKVFVAAKKINGIKSSLLNNKSRRKNGPRNASMKRKAEYASPPAKGKISSEDTVVVAIEESLPQVLHTQRSLGEKLLQEVKEHHRWAAVIYHHAESFPRSLRVLSLAANIVAMLFVQSITYNLSNPDDGQCATLKSETACLQPQASFGNGESKCDWVAGSGSGSGTCVFSEPTNSFTIIIFVAMISALLSSPIAILQTIIIHRFLAAPTKTGGEEENEENRNLADSSKEEEEFRRLSESMTAYRESLSQRELKEFDGNFATAHPPLQFVK